MNKKKLLGATALVLSMFSLQAFAQQQKSSAPSITNSIKGLSIKLPPGTNLSGEMDVVKAILINPNAFGDDENVDVLIEIASVKYSDAGFFLDLSKPIPSEYLSPAYESPDDVPETMKVSDLTYKTSLLSSGCANGGALSILGFKDGKPSPVGEFFYGKGDDEDEYGSPTDFVYVDRDVTIIGSNGSTTYKLHFKKGWNIQTHKILNEEPFEIEETTSKPNGFKWYFTEDWCISNDGG